LGPSVAMLLGSGVVSAIVAGIFSFYSDQEKTKEGRAQALELEQRKFSYEVLKEIWSISDRKRQADFAMLTIAMQKLLPEMLMIASTF
jgi:hypothetical protein